MTNKQQVKLYLRETTTEALEPFTEDGSRSEFIEEAIWEKLTMNGSPDTPDDGMTPAEKVEFYEERLAEAEAELEASQTLADKKDASEDDLRALIRQRVDRLDHAQQWESFRQNHPVAEPFTAAEFYAILNDETGQGFEPPNRGVD